MKKTHISIFIFALIMLSSGLFFVTKSIRNSGIQQKKEALKDSLVAEKKIKLNVFADGNAANQDKDISQVMGSIDAITENTLTIRHLRELTIVNTDGSTAVMIIKGKNQPVIGQMADLKLGDTARVAYDKTSLEANMIYLMLP